jgi:PST family polysaccharide transporter
VTQVNGSATTTPDLLSLEPVHAELRKRSVRSGLIAAGGRVMQGVIALGSVAILARILTPTDFGLVAMVMPVTTVVSMTMYRGLQVALLHEEAITASQLSRLYWVAFRFNVISVSAMALLGPVLAAIYREPRVTMVAAIWALSLFVQSLCGFHESLLKRQLRFGTLTMVNVTGMFTGAILSIAGAASGMGHFALLLQFLAWDAVRCVAAWTLVKWRPDRREWSGPGDPVISRLSDYGRHFAQHRGVYWAGRQADRIVVGAIAGAAMLGLYDSARRWSWYAFHELFQSVSDVMVTSLSRARANLDRFRSFFRHGLMAFLVPPLAAIAFVFVEAEAAVRVLLGEKWVDAIPIVRIMCGAAFFDAISRLTMWLYTAEGRTRQQFHWSLITTPIMLAAIAAGATRGMRGVAWAFAVTTAALMVPTVAFCLRGSAMRSGDFVAMAWRPVTCSIIAGILLALSDPFLPGSREQLPGFIAALLAYLVLYVMAWMVLPGGVSASRMMRDGVRQAFGGTSA